MKIILSRKGFDSSAGGYPSPILPDGTLMSIPIPDQDSTTNYHDLLMGDTTYCQLMKTIKGSIKTGNNWSELTENTRCHLDPDIDSSVISRQKAWRGVFGQSGGAQRHLENQGVEQGDLFLFFGWFRNTVSKKGRLAFDPNDKKGRHIIYGYLQIEDILQIDSNSQVPGWMEGHPHCTPVKRNRSCNTIYLARKNLSWNDDLPGYSTFRYNGKQVLTKKGMNKSCWDLPVCFKNVPISYHKPSNWKTDHFQSVARGQEFVVDSSEEILNWAKQIIES